MSDRGFLLRVKTVDPEGHGGFFDRQRAELAGSHHCLAPDLHGHGETGGTGPELTIEAAADACAALMRARDLSDAVLVGWSMGAHVAFSMIERHGADGIAGLVVLDMTAKILNDETWDCGIAGGFDAGKNRLALRLMGMDWPTYAGTLTQNMFADGVAPKDDETTALLADVRANDPAMMTAMWSSLAEQDFRPLLPQLSVPTLLAHGARSRIYAPEVAERLAGMIPDSEG